MLFGGQELLRTNNEMCIPLLCALLPPKVATSVSLRWGLGICISTRSQVRILIFREPDFENH